MIATAHFVNHSVIMSHSIMISHSVIVSNRSAVRRSRTLHLLREGLSPYLIIASGGL